MNFDNNASRQGFIGKKSLEEVLQSDAAELTAIGGSFEAIAQRMSYFQSFFFEEKGEKKVAKTRLLQMASHFFCSKKEKWLFPYPEEYRQPERLLEGKYDLSPFDIWDGVQDCPFSGCNYFGARDIIVANALTGRFLIINDINIHLVKSHQLLEKHNAYGLSAREFYEQFMQ